MGDALLFTMKLAGVVILGAMAVMTIIFLVVVIAAVAAERKDGRKRKKSTCVNCHYFNEAANACEIFMKNPDWYEEGKMPLCIYNKGMNELMGFKEDY